jgi:hypothetical protein
VDVFTGGRASLFPPFFNLLWLAPVQQPSFALTGEVRAISQSQVKNDDFNISPNDL